MKPSENHPESLWSAGPPTGWPHWADTILGWREFCAVSWRSHPLCWGSGLLQTPREDGYLMTQVPEMLTWPSQPLGGHGAASAPGWLFLSVLTVLAGLPCVFACCLKLRHRSPKRDILTKKKPIYSYVYIYVYVCVYTYIWTYIVYILYILYIWIYIVTIYTIYIYCCIYI